jgi:hypothetical protein
VTKLAAAYADKRDIIKDHSNVQLTPEHQAFLDKNSLSEEMVKDYLKIAKKREIEVILMTFFKIKKYFEFNGYICFANSVTFKPYPQHLTAFWTLTLIIISTPFCKKQGTRKADKIFSLYLKRTTTKRF